MKNRLFEAIAMMVGMVIGLAVIITLFINLLFGAGLITFLVVFAVLTAITCFTSVVNMFVVDIPANHGAVLSNKFRQLPPPSSNPEILAPTDALREVGQGYQGKWPWEEVYKVIDLTKEVKYILKFEAVSKEGIALEGEWQDIFTPLVGYLCNLVRHDPDAAEAYFIGRITSFLKEFLSKEYAEETSGNQSIFQKIDSLKEDFKKLFGGPECLSDEEKNWGLYTNTPMIRSLKRSDAFQKSVEGRVISANTARNIQGLINSGEGRITGRQATIIAMTAAGMDTSNIEDRGVEFTGIPEGISSFAVGAGVFHESGDNKPKDKKDKK